jgi:Lon protease-like protein
MVQEAESIECGRMSINKAYSSIDQLPQRLPLFPLAGALLLPRGELPLNIFEPRYVAMVDAAVAATRLIGMVQPLPGSPSTAPELFEIGCVGRITQFGESGDGRYLIMLTGVCRFRIASGFDHETPYRVADVDFGEFAHDLEVGAGESAVDRRGMIDMLRKFADSSKIEVDWSSVDAAPTETLVNALAMMSPFGVREKQLLLESIDLKTRAETLIDLARFDMSQSEAGSVDSDRTQAH